MGICLFKVDNKDTKTSFIDTVVLYSLVPLKVVLWRRGYHYCTTSFKKA